MRKDMRMKRNFFVLTIMLAMFLFIGNVNAEEKTCKPTELSELRTLAANVKVTYVPTTVVEKLEVPEPEVGADTVTARYLYIKIYNVTDKLLVTVTNGGDSVSGGIKKTLSSKDIGSDGAITLRQRSISEMVDYNFKIFSTAYGCSGETLRTMKLTLPRFNYYSELDICKDIPDYYLCQQYTTFKVDGATFYDKVDEYKAKLLTQKDDEVEDNTGLFNKTMNAVSDYKYVVVGIVVAIGVVLTIVILKRKKSVK